jgi:DNA-binding PadR family transcriptional regulator
VSVRQSLLAILDQAPCYGYQLRAEFDRRTGSTWPLNVGQIYNTLDRLERDGLVRKGETDDHGHVYYEITDAGSAEVAAWLASPIRRTSTARDELAMKIAVAATLPGADVASVIRTQRRSSLAQLDELTRDPAVGDPAVGDPPDGVLPPEDLARTLILDAMMLHAEAELRWLDRVQERLAQHPSRSMSLELATERPKRGRPARVA